MMGHSSAMALQSPWRWGGAVGLGIVAAMSKDGAHRSEKSPAAVFTRCEKIPVSPPLLPVLSMRLGQAPATVAREDQEKEELSECYTCVISHVGGKHVRRVEYFDDGGGECFELPPPRSPIPLSPLNFLSCCHLCRKELHGLDIFIYRGEKAFCSAECRHQQMSSDEQKKKKKKKQTPKAVKSLKLSARDPPFFSVSVAAAS